MKKYKIACAIILNTKQDKILLSKRARNPFKNKWALISGIGESMKGIAPEIGVIEEVNCDLGTKSFKIKSHFKLPIRNDEKADEIFVFIGTIKESEIKVQSKYSKGIKWINIDDIDKLQDTAFDHHIILKEYLKRSC